MKATGPHCSLTSHVQAARGMRPTRQGLANRSTRLALLSYILRSVSPLALQHQDTPYPTGTVPFPSSLPTAQVRPGRAAGRPGGGAGDRGEAGQHAQVEAAGRDGAHGGCVDPGAGGYRNTQEGCGTHRPAGPSHAAPHNAPGFTRPSSQPAIVPRAMSCTWMAAADFVCLYTCTGHRLRARAQVHSPAPWPAGKLDLAAQCLTRASDFSGLLMLAAARGDREGMAGVGAAAAAGGKANVAFLAYFLLGRLNDCLDLLLDSNRWGRELQGRCAHAICGGLALPAWQKLQCRAIVTVAAGWAG